MFISKMVFKIQPTVPSPPATKIRQEFGLIFATKRNASRGPVEFISITCNGCKMPRNIDTTSAELLSPDFELAMTKSGRQSSRLGGVRMSVKRIRPDRAGALATVVVVTTSCVGGMIMCLYSPKSQCSSQNNEIFGKQLLWATRWHQQHRYPYKPGRV